VELQGLGGAIVNAFRVAEMLTSLDYANTTRVETALVTLEGAKTAVPKVIVTMTRGPNFEKVWEEFEKARNPVDLLQTKK
jgi:hypothetical protein